MRLIAVVALALLAGCHSPIDNQAVKIDDSGMARVRENFFYGYGAAIIADVKAQLAGTQMPPETQSDYAQCWSDSIIMRLSKDELDRMDRFARGQIALPQKEVEQVPYTAMERAGTTDRWEFMRPYCPGFIAEFKQYL